MNNEVSIAAEAPPRRRRAMGVAQGRSATRKRVLIVNVFFDEYRRTGGSPYRVPRAMGPVFLAGAFSADLCDVRLYSEQYSGPLADADLLAWPDMLVLTGLTNGFDRMLHLTAYARTLNPKVVVVAGGPAIRALPKRARTFFDYPCVGDIEELQSIVADVFGRDHVADDPFPRFDLASPSRLLGYVESSRACNFRCSFCSLTAEKARYAKYDLEYVRRQILAVGRKRIVFVDNNFYGNDREFFLARVEMLGDLYRSGRIRGWSALVTGDFFSRPENLALVRAAGCDSLFSGVESFDAATLQSYNKRQNTLTPQVEMIRNCLEAGVFFAYGIMLDPTTRPVAELRREIEFILGTPEISLPAFFTLPIPLLGTPYFRDCIRDGLMLPNIRLRDLDGITLAVRPVDPLPEALTFVRDLPSLRGHRAKVLHHVTRFLRLYGRRLSTLQLAAECLSGALIAMECFASSPGRTRNRQQERTYYGPTETLDPLYEPMIRVAGEFEPYFRPTMVTDAVGGLASELVPDLGGTAIH